MTECVPYKNPYDHKKPMEQILLMKAAIRCGDVVYTDWRHHLILWHMKENNLPRTTLDDQGFIDQDGCFYRRACCCVIAFTNGQTKEYKRTLTSEDLWDEEGNHV